jgi:hypothetical protein
MFPLDFGSAVVGLYDGLMLVFTFYFGFRGSDNSRRKRQATGHK